MPMSVVGCFEELDSALASAASFVASVLKHRASLFGSEGTNAGLARAVEAMVHCFDWGRLTEKGPDVHTINEFGVLIELLLPYLRFTDWPNETDFPAVVHRWPPTDVLKVMYVLFCKRLREVRWRLGHASAWLAGGSCLPCGESCLLRSSRRILTVHEEACDLSQVVGGGGLRRRASLESRVCHWVPCPLERVVRAPQPEATRLDDSLGRAVRRLGPYPRSIAPCELPRLTVFG